jgi:hypothetical protein
MILKDWFGASTTHPFFGELTAAVSIKQLRNALINKG